MTSARTCYRCGEDTLSVHAEPGSLCEDCLDEIEDEDLDDGVDTSSYSREDELLDEDLARGESDYEDCP